MLNNLKNTIKELNSDVNNVANSEKATKLRKKLIKIGLSVAIPGFTSVLGGFITFMIGNICYGFGVVSIIGFVLFLLGGFAGAIGMTIASYGFSIVIVGKTSQLINETVGNNCPNCGDTITAEELFCSKCGTKLKVQCPKCNHVNQHSNDYCVICGEQLPKE